MAEKQTANSGYDLMLLIPTVFLLAIGLVVVYSASSNLAALRMNDGNYFLKRQAVYCILGILMMIILRNVPEKYLHRGAYPLLGLSFALLLALHIPGLGLHAGGATRWLRLGGLAFQPSEMAKFSLAVFLAYSMAKKGLEMSSFTKGVLFHLAVIGVMMLLILSQPDLGTTVIIGAWTFVMLFVGGARFWQLGILAAAAIPPLIYMIMHAEYRVKRLMAFLDPWEDPQGIGFQIIHSFLAFGSGGFLGVGLGNSKQKLFYLPEPHTDFALSIAAEEMGFVGVALITILFGILIMRGIYIALNARDLYSSYLAFGLSFFLGLQVLINMSVVMGLLPTKGLTLPFISYGGSALVMNLMAVGILMRISAKQ